MRTNPAQHFIQMYTCTHLLSRSVIPDQRASSVSSLMIRIKHFICSQRCRNYIFSMLITFKKQITVVKQCLSMRP